VEVLWGSTEVDRTKPTRPSAILAFRLSDLVDTSMSSRRSRPTGQSPSRGELEVTRRAQATFVASLAAMLLIRVLTDDHSAPNSRHSGSLNLSGAIAVLFIVAAMWLLQRLRRGTSTTILVALWLCIFTAVAVSTSGASSETLREGVRETSVVAIAVIAYNARRMLSVSIATRILQFVGLVPAILALYQLATHTGLDVAHNIRANGTFAHPNSAAMSFAIATTVSLWAFLDDGRRRLDAALTVTFASALIATFSIDGVITLAAMLLTFGALRPGPLSSKLIPWGAAGLVVLAFFATPLGAKRVAGESSTSLTAAERGETTSSLDTRLYRWKTLLPQWEESPVFGRGLGTTTTSTKTRQNRLNGLLPHNEYIRYLVETGVLGSLVLLAALWLLVRALLRRRRVRVPADSRGYNAPALGLAIVVGCLVNSIADNTLLNSPTGYAAALILGATLALPVRDADASEAGWSPVSGGEISSVSLS
jgi:O-antigen ligase